MIKFISIIKMEVKMFICSNPNPKGKVAFNSASDYVKRFNDCRYSRNRRFLWRYGL